MGRMSRNARKSSSSRMRSAGISPVTILLKALGMGGRLALPEPPAPLLLAAAQAAGAARPARERVGPVMEAQAAEERHPDIVIESARGPSGAPDPLPRRAHRLTLSEPSCTSTRACGD